MARTIKGLPEGRECLGKTPDSRLLIDPTSMGLQEPTRTFFRRPTRVVARDLIGAWVARRHEGRWFGARIVETEAYLGARDAAAHSWRGRRTPRVEPMYLDGGHLYVFLVYGMHSCANVVTRTAGTAEAVLLRAAEGPPGAPPKLLSGPGRLCAALGITVVFSGQDLLADRDVRIFRRVGRRPPIGRSPRIGVDYAGDARLWPLRFFALGSPAISGPRSLQAQDGVGRGAP